MVLLYLLEGLAAASALVLQEVRLMLVLSACSEKCWRQTDKSAAGLLYYRRRVLLRFRCLPLFFRRLWACSCFSFWLRCEVLCLRAVARTFFNCSSFWVVSWRFPGPLLWLVRRFYLASWRRHMRISPQTPRNYYFSGGGLSNCLAALRHTYRYDATPAYLNCVRSKVTQRQEPCKLTTAGFCPDKSSR